MCLLFINLTNMKIIIFLFLSYTALFSQLSIKVNNLYLDNNNYLNAEVTLTNNGVGIVPNIEDILLIELNKSNKAVSVDRLSDKDIRINFKPVYSVVRDPKAYIGKLVINYNNMIVDTDLNLADLNNPRIIFTKPDGSRVETTDFGISSVGSKKIRQAYLRTNASRIVNGNIVSTRVDSISINNPAFQVTWDGQLGGMGNPQPPLSILPSVNYLLTFTFTPTTTDPYSAVFTVYYDNGAKAELLFTGNNLIIKEDEVEKFFKVKEPNGGQKLAPCLDIPITWEGNTNGFNTSVEYSNNNGKSWSNIGSSTSGSFLWDVPKDITDSAKIKISQEFRSFNPIVTQTGKDTVVELNYSYGDNLIKIFNTNRINLDISGDFYLGNSVGRTSYFGSGFLSEDNFVVGFRDLNKNINSDSILIYNTSQQFPIKRFVANAYPIQSLKSDQKNGKFYILQDYGRKIYEYDENGLLDSIEFNDFISSFSIAKDSSLLSAISYSGNLFVYNLKNKNIQKTIKIEGTPYIVNNTISPNGKIIALGGKINDVSKEAAYIYLVDVASGSIFKIFEVSASDPISLSFNPNSSILVIVSKWSPQILIWDLIGDKSISGFGGASGEVIAGSFASSNNTILISSKKPNELTKYTLVFPLYDESDSTFRIIDPIISANKIEVEQNLIFTKDSSYFENHICNNGEVDFVFDNYRFNSGKNYNVQFDKFKDTLSPNECGSFKIYFEPQDIGTLNDTLNVTNSCETYLQIPISGVGLPRNVEYFSNEYSLGTVCINDTIAGTINLFRNLDTTNLNITQIEIISTDAIFSILNFNSQILNLNDTLKLNYLGSPLFAGENKIKLRVYFNNQSKYYFEIDLKIDGIGSTLEASHSYLPFIKEEGNRILKIKNQFDKPITLLGNSFIPNNGYQIVSSLPNVILPGEEISIEISWDGIYSQPVRLIIDADPCPLGNNFVLLPYSSTNFIEIPDVIASTPASDISIPIITNDSPNYDYKGTRNFDLSISLNPRLFFPISVSSKFGTASIVSNSIENDLRKINIKLSGDFPKQDTLMLINGVSGIAETDFTTISFNQQETSFGQSTNIIYNDGSLKINGLHNDRRVIHTYLNKMSIININPNPSVSNFNIDIKSEINEKIDLIIRNTTGQVVYITKENIKVGDNQLNVGNLNISNGNYILEININGKIIDSRSLKIIK